MSGLEVWNLTIDLGNRSFLGCPIAILIVESLGLKVFLAVFERSLLYSFACLTAIFDHILPQEWVEPWDQF